MFIYKLKKRYPLFILTKSLLHYKISCKVIKKPPKITKMQFIIK